MNHKMNQETSVHENEMNDNRLAKIAVNGKSNTFWTA